MGLARTDLDALRNELEAAYRKFFRRMGIHRRTGRLKGFPGKKFATYPYIGSRYGASRRILFVGLDLGIDPERGRIQDFEGRREAIEGKRLPDHNPNISGTCITALYFLKEARGWNGCWDRLRHLPTFKQALRRPDMLPVENPLAYVALTNYYKFAAEGRTERSGPQDRKHLDEKAERQLFLEEVAAFDPDIVIFQGVSCGFPETARWLKEQTGREVRIGPHPSYRGRQELGHFVGRIGCL